MGSHPNRWTSGSRPGTAECNFATQQAENLRDSRAAILRWLLLLIAWLAGATAWAQQQTPAPEFHPPDGSSTSTNMVISVIDPNTVVYFTTDGTAPTVNSTRYTTPIYVTNTTTFRAQAFLAGFTPSEERTATYYERPDLADMQKLVANNRTPVPSVQLAVTPAPAVRCWAIEDTIPRPLRVQNVTGGGVWDEVNRTIRWGPFADAVPRSFSYQVTHQFDDTFELESVASFNGISSPAANVSTRATVTLVHPSGTVATPVFTPSGGTSAPVEVTISCMTTNASIYFTTDGRVPGTNDFLYDRPLMVLETTFLRARAFFEGYEASDTSAAAYWAAENPAAVARTLTNRMDGTASVKLHLLGTTGRLCSAVTERLPNFLEPTEISHNGVWQAEAHEIRWGPFRNTLPTNLSYSVTGPDGDYTLEGTASVDGWSLSATGATTVSLVKVIEQVATPVFTPPGGTNVPVTVAITCAAPGAVIYFTTNGAVPTTNDLPYTGTLALTTTTMLRARAFKTGGYPSEVVDAAYWEVIERPAAARTLTNNASPLPEVRLAVATLSGTRTYAVEEQLPRLVTPMGLGQGGTWDEVTGTIRWGPFRDNLPRTLSYQLAGIAGTHALAGVVSLDGRSYAITGVTEVAIVSLLEQQVATPVLSPSGSTSVPVAVTITSTTTGAEIRYTTDSRVPVLTDSLYTGPLTVGSSRVDLQACKLEYSIVSPK